MDTETPEPDAAQAIPDRRAEGERRVPAGRLRAEGRLVHLGGQTATADARLVGPDGKLYGHGSTTCLVFELRPQSRP